MVVEYFHFLLFLSFLVPISKTGKMRLLAIVPMVLCTVALILSLLCLFAGSKKGFMEDYAVLTVSALMMRLSEYRQLT